MRIRAKIYMLVLAGGLSAVAVAGTAMYGFLDYYQRVTVLEQTLRRAHLAEKLNRLVTAVVMESRGIYHAASVEKAKPFATKLEADLKDLEALLTTWKPIVPDDDRTSFDQLQAQSATFAAFRRNIADQGVTVGPQAADALGNNDENRKNRQAFQDLIEKEVKATQAAAAEIQADMADYSTEITEIMLGMTLLGLIVGVGFAAYVGTAQLSRPLSRVASALKRIAGGDLTALPERRDSGDEIAEIWNAVRQFVASLQENEGLKARQVALEARTEAEKREAMQALADRFEAEVMGVVRSVAAAAQQLQGSATQMNVTAEQTSQRSQVVAAASEQTTGNVNTVASAAEELSASVREISNQVSGSSSIAQEASGKAKAAAEAAQGLSVSAHRIGEVVSLINDIAAQTNLLALNATIEAARAGEAGRGFAVVAQEVKGLAEQTAKATGEIAGQIQAVQGTARTVVGAIDGIGVTIERINQISTSIATAVEEQGAATTEIARNVTQAAQGTRDVSANISEVSEAASSTSRGSLEIVAASNELARQAEALRSKVDAFINKVRAA